MHTRYRQISLILNVLRHILFNVSSLNLGIINLHTVPSAKSRPIGRLNQLHVPAS